MVNRCFGTKLWSWATTFVTLVAHWTTRPKPDSVIPESHISPKKKKQRPALGRSATLYLSQLMKVFRWTVIPRQVMLCVLIAASRGQSEQEAIEKGT